VKCSEPSSTRPRPQGFYGFKGSYSIDTIETPDDLPTVVRLNIHAGVGLYSLYCYSSIHNPKTYENSARMRTASTPFDGTGPFRLQENTPGDKLVIMRNDDYALGAAIREKPGAAASRRHRSTTTSRWSAAPPRSRRATWTSSWPQSGRRRTAETKHEFHRDLEADAGGVDGVFSTPIGSPTGATKPARQAMRMRSTASRS